MFNIQSIAERQYLLCVLRPEVRYETRAAIGWFKIEQSGKPPSEKMTSHGSVSDLPADIVSVDRVLIRLHCLVRTLYRYLKLTQIQHTVHTIWRKQTDTEKTVVYRARAFWRASIFVHFSHFI